MDMACNICASTDLDIIYKLDARAINSLGIPQGEETEIASCLTCGHTLTAPFANVADFYDKRYNILTSSEDEDQLLKIVKGEKIFRSDFQADMLTKRIPLKPGMRLLDYGCAKAQTLKKLIKRAAITPFTFDVSANYQPFWQGVIPSENQSLHTLPAAWSGTMDVVSSFFCLEHVAAPMEAFAAQHRLLKNGGTLFFIVPNFHTNVADLLVFDHINHFTACSLRQSLASTGFIDIALDNTTQPGWWFVSATKNAKNGSVLPTPTEVAATTRESKDIATYWSRITQRLKKLSVSDDVAIYGAGFYGTYAKLHLDPSINVRCFIDQNKFLQGTMHMKLPVIAPADLPSDVRYILVALNPRTGRHIISQIDAWKALPLTFSYGFE